MKHSKMPKKDGRKSSIKLLHKLLDDQGVEKIEVRFFSLQIPTSVYALEYIVPQLNSEKLGTVCILKILIVYHRGL